MTGAHRGGLGRTPDGIREVADGVSVITRALTNSYLVDTDDGVVLIDAGLPRSWPLLVEALARRGRTPDDLVSVYLTYGHGRTASAGSSPRPMPPVRTEAPRPRPR